MGCPFKPPIRPQAPKHHPYPAQVDTRLADDMLPNDGTSPLRKLLDSTPVANDGWLSYDYGFCPPKPLRMLPAAHPLGAMLEQWVAKFPVLFRTGGYIEYFSSFDAVDATGLMDEDLLRANAILGLAAHATWHLAIKPLELAIKPLGQTECLPQSITAPWKQISARLGRPCPTFTYYDYFTANVTHTDRPREAHFDLDRKPADTYTRCTADIRVFGDKVETHTAHTPHLSAFGAHW